MIPTIKHWVFWILLAIGFNIFVVGPMLSIFLYFQAPPISNVVRTVLTPKVPPGGQLKIRGQADVSGHCSATVFRFVIDASGVVHAYAPVVNNNIMADTLITLTIPIAAAPGPAHYRAQAEWNCNYVQSWFPYIRLRPDLDFEITQPDGQAVPEKFGSDYRFIPLHIMQTVMR